MPRAVRDTHDEHHNGAQMQDAVHHSATRTVINLRQLEVLRAVIRYRTTIGAAEELGMSQPAVSNAIKLAEAKVGVPLFDRVSNRLLPTAEAQQLLADAEPIFRLYETIQRKAWDLRTGRAGVLRLAASAELSQYLVPRALKLFMQDHPGVRVTVETVRVHELMEIVESGGADLGIAMRPPARPSIVREVLAQAEIVCICPPDEPLGQKASITPRDLRGRAFIGPSPGTPLGMLIDAAFERAGEVYNPAIEARFSNVASAMVDEGVGIALLDELTARSRLDAPYTVHSLEPRVTMDVCGLALQERPMSRMSRAFLAKTRQVLDAWTRSWKPSMQHQERRVA